MGQRNGVKPGWLEVWWRHLLSNHRSGTSLTAEGLELNKEILDVYKLTTTFDVVSQVYGSVYPLNCTLVQ